MDKTCGTLVFKEGDEDWIQKPPTLNICTPMTANMNCSNDVTNNMLPIVLMATITHWTTCYNHGKNMSDVS